MLEVGVGVPGITSNKQQLFGMASICQLKTSGLGHAETKKQRTNYGRLASDMRFNNVMAAHTNNHSHIEFTS